MPGFDITSILDFQPPRVICPACRGLIRHPQRDKDDEGRATFSCPVCEVMYVDVDEDVSGLGTAIYELLNDAGCMIDHRSLLTHATALAQLIHDSRGGAWGREPWPTLRTFFEVLSRARYFVHFTSWGISHVMIGALRMASMRVPVFGFASNVPQHVMTELTEFPREAPNLKAKIINTSQALYDAPHQKLLIIDGLVAFKGSTNLTGAGMRRADRNLDISEVVTDYEQVTTLNNKYFAPVWRRITAPSDTYSLLPF